MQIELLFTSTNSVVAVHGEASQVLTGEAAVILRRFIIRAQLAGATGREPESKPEPEPKPRRAQSGRTARVLEIIHMLDPSQPVNTSSVFALYSRLEPEVNMTEVSSSIHRLYASGRLVRTGRRGPQWDYQLRTCSPLPYASTPTTNQDPLP